MLLNIIARVLSVIKTQTVVVILVMSVTNQGFGQMNTVQSIAGQFDSYQQRVLQEKLFVHTDKNFYMVGEILWFKMYNVEGNHNKPIDLSKVAYLEILDKDQNSIIQTKVLLKKDSTNGSIYIPVSINSGNYKLRAYTNWMKNFSPDFYFEKNITIINSLKDADLITAEKPPLTYNIAFFPEGGNLVNGIKSKIAFKTTDQYGKGIEVEGSLTDQNDETVASFKSLKFGMGTFYLTPEDNMKYIALIKLSNGQILKKELPTIFKNGYVMHVKDAPQSGKLLVTVQCKGQSDSEIYLFVHTRNVKKIAESMRMINGEAEILLDKDKLEDGISGITVFNSDGQPVCERLYFKYPKQNLLIETTTDAGLYASRKKVNVNVSLKDLKNIPLVADMSVSVFRLDSLNLIESNDISSHLWLTSDLKGIIESPDYYFKNNRKEEAMDNLMLTHGWRRFKWEDILQNKIPSFEFLPEYTGHIITGRITDSQTKRPISNAVAYLSVPGKRVQFYNSKSNTEGQINFYTKDFYGSKEILTHLNTSADSAYTITISNPFSSKFSTNILSSFHPYKNLFYSQLLSNGVNMQVQNIYWGDKMKQFYSSVKDSSAFYGLPSRTYELDKYTRFTTMEEVLREFIYESGLSLSKKQYALRLLRHGQKIYFDKQPLILLDGMPVFNANQIIAYDPIKVKTIEVVNKEYFLGTESFEGIISFRTYKGDSPGFQAGSGTTSIDYEGLQLQREFYSPVYETEKQISSRLPDFRNLLYWSPNVGTDTQGKKQFSFYTSDQTGKYALVLQGITAKGDAINKVLTFEVKNAL